MRQISGRRRAGDPPQATPVRIRLDTGHDTAAQAKLIATPAKIAGGVVMLGVQGVSPYSPGPF